MTRPMLLGAVRAADAAAACAAAPGVEAVVVGDLAALLLLADRADARDRVAVAAQVAACVRALAPVAHGRVGPEQAAAWATGHAAALNAALDRLEDCAEWIATVPAAPAEPAAGQDDGGCAAATGAAASGAAWLRARAASAAAAARAADAAGRRARSCAATLGGVARDVRIGRFEDAAAGGGGVDLAVLAARDAGPALAARAPGLAFSGPWPAYSFVDVPA